MATLVLTLDLDPARADEARQRVRAEVIPWVRRLPGFRRGRWMHSRDHSYCLVVVEFASEAEACNVAELARAQSPNAARSWNFDRVLLADEAGQVDCPPGFAPPVTG